MKTNSGKRRTTLTRGLVAGLGAVAMAAALTATSPEEARALDCGGTNNLTGTNAGKTNAGLAAGLTCNQNNVVGDEIRPLERHPGRRIWH